MSSMAFWRYDEPVPGASLNNHGPMNNAFHDVQAPVSAVAPAPPSSFFYYSHEAGPVHSIFLSPYST